MKKLAFFASAALIATTAMPAAAAPIFYTITGVFSGSTAGGAFNDVSATFTGIGDTSTATTGGFGIPSYVAVNLSSFTAFTPGDNHTYTITSPGTFGVYKASDLLGPAATQTRLGFIFDGNGSNGIALESNAYNGYSGLTSFATTAGSVYYSAASFDTTEGRINITGFTGGTFGATAVPEPATWAMMLLGFGMVGFGLRRRQASKVTTRVAFG